eukprot:GHVU01052300.1.p1 GENE.GHVU01052300.1~~GHVU01052300.1.p1  ORF type:complete len:241 (+),score=48.92 GHVU01052300.1:486-1208(+)
MAESEMTTTGGRHWLFARGLLRRGGGGGDEGYDPHDDYEYPNTLLGATTEQYGAQPPEIETLQSPYSLIPPAPLADHSLSSSGALNSRAVTQPPYLLRHFFSVDGGGGGENVGNSNRRRLLPADATDNLQGDADLRHLRYHHHPHQQQQIPSPSPMFSSSSSSSWDGASPWRPQPLQHARHHTRPHSSNVGNGADRRGAAAPACADSNAMELSLRVQQWGEESRGFRGDGAGGGDRGRPA